MKRKLAKKLKELASSTGIDFLRYKSPELIGRVVQLISFPLYAAKTLFIPWVLILLAVVAFWIFVPIPGTFEKIIFAFLSAFALPVLGIPIGMTVLVRRVLEDVGGILGESMELAETVIKDQDQIVDSVSKNIDPGDVLKGVVFGAVIPSLSAALKKKMGFLAKLVSWPVNRVLFYAADLLGNTINTLFGEAKEKVAQSGVAQKLGSKKSDLADFLGESRGVVNDVTGKAAFSAGLPFMLSSLGSLGFYTLITLFLLKIIP